MEERVQVERKEDGAWGAREGMDRGDKEREGRVDVGKRRLEESTRVRGGGEEDTSMTWEERVPVGSRGHRRGRVWGGEASLPVG